MLRLLFRVRIEGAERFAAGPAIYCFNHLNWTDPLFVLAFLPERPRYALFGPKEEDMTRGGRNRLITWAGLAIPYRPAKTDLLETTRRVARVLDGGLGRSAWRGRGGSTGASGSCCRSPTGPPSSRFGAASR